MGEAHAGRLLDHVHLRVADLAVSRRFYDAVLGVVGIPVRGGEHAFAADELYVSGDGPVTQGFHLAFQAADEETVHRFYEAGLAAGGRENGAPASGPIIRATTPRSCSTRTETTSRRCITGRSSVPRRRSFHVGRPRVAALR